MKQKKLGIKTPGRTWEAKKKVPNMVYVPAHFEQYWEITQKFLNICKDYSPYVELFSLDEVFIDITKTEDLFNGRYELIKIIKERIRKEIGEYITVSVGLSYNKLLSKLASGMNKPDGFAEIWEEDVEKIYSKVELIALCGIGERVKERLNKIEIYTPLDLRKAPLDKLIREFKDVEGYFLKNLGLAYDSSPVVPYYFPEETKSVGRNYCAPQNTYDKRAILQHIYELSEEVGIKLRRLGKKGRTVGLWLGGNKSMHGRKTIKGHIDQGHEIYALCKGLYDAWEWGERSKEDGMVRQFSIWVGNLEDGKNLTLSLFDLEPKKSAALETVDKLNEKFGDHTVRKGFLLGAPNLKTVPNGWGADRFERSKLVGTVT